MTRDITLIAVLILVIKERVIPSFNFSASWPPCLNPSHKGKGDSRWNPATGETELVLMLVIKERVIPVILFPIRWEWDVLILVIKERVIPKMKNNIQNPANTS